MNNEKINPTDSIDVQITRGAGSSESFDLHGVFTAICHDKNGNLKWEDEFNNTVLTAGKNAILNIFMGTAAVNANRSTWFMGLIASNGYSAIATADTHASHAGWIESGATNGLVPRYSQSTRRQVTFAAASAGSKATSNAVIFSIDVAGTAKGAFIANNSTKASTNASGVIYSAGLFTVGDKVLTGGDTLSITYTASA